MTYSTGSLLHVTVYLHTLLQRQSPEGPQSELKLELPAGETVGSLMLNLEIDLPLDALLLVVNGRHAEPDQPLHDGDEVHFIPALSGG